MPETSENVSTGVTDKKEQIQAFIRFCMEKPEFKENLKEAIRKEAKKIW